MSTPTPFLIRMGIFLIIIAIGVFLIYPTLADAFLANAVINGVILDYTPKRTGSSASA